MPSRKLGTSRRGKPPIALQTLINRIAKTAAVSTEEAIDAARTLHQAQNAKTRASRYANAGLVGGTLSPVVRGLGRAAEGATTAAQGQRLAGAAKGFVKGFAKENRGELARHVTEGALGAGGVRAVQEGLELDHAKRKLVTYLKSEPKVASAERKEGVRRIVQLLAGTRRKALGDISAKMEHHGLPDLARQARGEQHVEHGAVMATRTLAALPVLAGGAAYLGHRSKKTAAIAAKIPKAPALQRLPPVQDNDLDFEV